MDLLSLYYFSEIAKDLHITKTANRIFVSQQTLSNHLQRLESHYKTLLLSRKPSLELTDAGISVLKFANTVIKAETNLKDVIYEIENQQQGTLRIGASSSRATYFFPKIFSDFSAKYPKVQIICRHNISAKSEKEVLSGDLDLAIVLNHDLPPQLISQHLFEDQVYLCVSEKLLKEHYGDFAETIKDLSMEGADLKHFAKLPFSIMSNRLGGNIRDSFSMAGYDPNISLIAEYSTIAFPHCQQGLSACFLSQMFLLNLDKSQLKNINIFPLYSNETPMIQDFSVIRQRDRYLSSYAKYFLELLFKVFEDIERHNLTQRVTEQNIYTRF